MLVSVYNVEISYEDLGLDYGGEIYVQFFNDLVGILMGDYFWLLEKYCIFEV